MGTAWFLARSTAALQSDALQLIIVASVVIIAVLLIYVATRKRHATQWVVYGCIILLVTLTSIFLIYEAINSIVNVSELHR